MTVVTPTLRKGASGARVRALHAALHRRGLVHSPGELFGELTEDAVESFQAGAGLVADGVVGPLTAARLNAAASPPPAASLGMPPWLVTARRYLGTREIAGRAHDDVIMSFSRKIATRYPALAWARAIFTSDEVPWCGAFVAYVMAESGIEPDRRYPSALAWADWGQPLAGPVRGAVCVKSRDGGGHVALVAGRTASGHLAVLGGNQGNMVKISPYNRAAFNAFRWPPGLALPAKAGFDALPLVGADGGAGPSER